MAPSLNHDVIGLTQPETLLEELANRRHLAGIRFEMKDQGLPGHFSTVLVFSRHAILLTHTPIRALTNGPAPDQVAAFEIDQPRKVFLPFQHYVISAVCERFKGKRNGLLHA